MASTDAVKSIEEIQDLSAPEQITSALQKLSKARDAFAVAEASLYYPDPETPGETELLPSTLAASPEDLDIDLFRKAEAALESRLEAGSLTSGDGEAEKALQHLAEETKKVAVAWRPALLGNFRNAVFLPDKQVIGRILQGAIAKGNFLVLASLQAKGAEQISREIQALKTILDGKYLSQTGEPFVGKGLLEAYADIDPEEAEKLRAKVDSLELSAISQPTPDTSSYIEVRDLILKMAAALGYEQFYNN